MLLGKRASNNVGVGDSTLVYIHKPVDELLVASLLKSPIQSGTLNVRSVHTPWQSHTTGHIMHMGAQAVDAATW